MCLDKTVSYSSEGPKRTRNIKLYYTIISSRETPAKRGPTEPLRDTVKHTQRCLYLEEHVETKQTQAGVNGEHGSIVHLDPLHVLLAIFLGGERRRRKRKGQREGEAGEKGGT